MSDIFTSENGLGAGIYREVMKAVNLDLETRPPQEGSAALTLYQPGGPGAPVTDVEKKLREVVSVGDKGADATGAADASAAVQAARATSPAVYVPDGVFKVDGPIEGLYGPGELRIGGQRVRLPITPRRDNLLNAVLAKLVRVSRAGGMMAYVADSIGEGYFATALPNSWFNLLQKMLNARTANGGEPEVTNMTDTARYGLTYTGTYATGTAGPIERSVILQAGATLSFTGKYRFVDPVFEQKPGGGVLTLSRNGVVYRTIDTNGTLEHDKCLFPSDAGDGQTGDVYTFTVTGGPVEITGLWRLVYVEQPAIFASRMALSASSTVLHSSDTCIASVIRHTKSLNANAKPIIFVGLGINNTTAAPVGTSPDTYQAQLEKMFARYINSGAYVVALGMICPSIGWPASRAAYGAFAAAQVAACETYGVPLIAMDGADWVGEGAMLFDGLHPNDKGNLYMLDTILEALASPSFDPVGGTQGHRLREYAPSLTWFASGLAAGTIGTANVRYSRNGPYCRVIGNLSGIQPSANPAAGALCIGLPLKSATVLRCSGRIGNASGLTTAGKSWSLQTAGDGNFVAVLRSVDASLPGGFAEVTAVGAGSSIDFDIEYIVED